MDMSWGKPRESVMDRGAWRAAVHGVLSRTRPSHWTELNVFKQECSPRCFALAYLRSLWFYGDESIWSTKNWSVRCLGIRVHSKTYSRSQVYQFHFALPGIPRNVSWKIRSCGCCTRSRVAGVFHLLSRAHSHSIASWTRGVRIPGWNCTWPRWKNWFRSNSSFQSFTFLRSVRCTDFCLHAGGGQSIQQSHNRVRSAVDGGFLTLPESGIIYFWASSKLLFQRRQWHPTPVLLPGKSHGQRSLVGCSPWDHKDSDMTKWLWL